MWLPAIVPKSARCDKTTAAMILAVVDEQSKWLQFINSDDERLAFDTMKFLTQMRDGRPKQQINVDDERAREREELEHPRAHFVPSQCRPFLPQPRFLATHVRRNVGRPIEKCYPSEVSDTKHSQTFVKLITCT